jgi:hypothetical protein
MLFCGDGMTKELLSLTIENIEKLLLKQVVRLEKTFVACSNVARLMIHTQNEEICIVKGFIHLEKSAQKWYEVQVKFNVKNETIHFFECVCKGSMKQHCCKHVASLFFACIAIRNYENEDSPPKLFQHSKMKRFESTLKKLRDQVEFNLK